MLSILVNIYIVANVAGAGPQKSTCSGTLDGKHISICRSYLGDAYLKTEDQEPLELGAYQIPLVPRHSSDSTTLVYALPGSDRLFVGRYERTMKVFQLNHGQIAELQCELWKPGVCR